VGFWYNGCMKKPSKNFIALSTLVAIALLYGISSFIFPAVSPTGITRLIKSYSANAEAKSILQGNPTVEASLETACALTFPQVSLDIEGETSVIYVWDTKYGTIYGAVAKAYRSRFPSDTTSFHNGPLPERGGLGNPDGLNIIGTCPSVKEVEYGKFNHGDKIRFFDATGELITECNSWIVDGSKNPVICEYLSSLKGKDAEIILNQKLN